MFYNLKLLTSTGHSFMLAEGSTVLLHDLPVNSKLKISSSHSRGFKARLIYHWWCVCFITFIQPSVGLWCALKHYPMYLCCFFWIVNYFQYRGDGPLHNITNPQSLISFSYLAWLWQLLRLVHPTLIFWTFQLYCPVFYCDHFKRGFNITFLNNVDQFHLCSLVIQFMLDKPFQICSYIEKQMFQVYRCKYVSVGIYHFFYQVSTVNFHLAFLSLIYYSTNLSWYIAKFRYIIIEKLVVKLKLTSIDLPAFFLVFCFLRWKSSCEDLVLPGCRLESDQLLMKGANKGRDLAWSSLKWEPFQETVIL